MKKTVRIKIDIYSCNIVAIFTDDIGKALQSIIKKYNIENTPIVECSACTLDEVVNVSDYYIFFKIYEHGVFNEDIIHETNHCSDVILKDRDIPIQYMSEPHAYLNGFIGNKICQGLIKNKIPIYYGN